MLVTFRTNAYPDVTMFGDVALQLLQMMGHSGTVPGAVSADDVTAALERLRVSLKEMPEPGGSGPGDSEPSASEDNDEETPVPIRRRAFPLLELLEAAARSDRPVVWR